MTVKVKNYICELKSSGEKIISEFKQIQFNFGGPLARCALVDEDGVDIKYAQLAIERWNKAYVANPYKYYLPEEAAITSTPLHRPDIPVVTNTNQVWRYEASTKTIRSVPENYWIASMNSWDGAVDHKANVNLIAAAPELLRALESLYDAYKELADSGDAGFWSAEEKDEGILAIKAINKAKNGE